METGYSSLRVRSLEQTCFCTLRTSQARHAVLRASHLDNQAYEHRTIDVFPRLGLALPPHQHAIVRQDALSCQLFISQPLASTDRVLISEHPDRNHLTVKTLPSKGDRLQYLQARRPYRIENMTSLFFLLIVHFWVMRKDASGLPDYSEL